MRSPLLTRSLLLAVVNFAFPSRAFSDCAPQVLEPNGGESYELGTSVTVRWQNPIGCSISSISLSFSEDGGNNWYFFAAGLTGESYVWNLPGATLHGLVRVTIYGGGVELGSDTSDAEFAIRGGVENARFALHRKPHVLPIPSFCDNPATPTIEPNYSPNYDQIPCSEYTVNGPLGASIVYIVVGHADPTEGVVGASFGIDYDGRANQQAGIDPEFVTMTHCADGLAFVSDGGFGEFPKPKGGIRITWIYSTSCQREVIGSEGVHAVVGALYVYAYSSDLLRITPNTTRCCGDPPPELGVVTCGGGSTNLLNIFPPEEVSSLMGRVQFGEGTGGYTPCSPSTCSVTVAAIDVDPNTMNANAGGKFVTASIELPSGYDPGDVTPASIKLNETVGIVTGSLLIGDFNENLVPDFTVKFPRDAVEDVLEEGDQVPITITGSIGENCTFTGTDLVRVIRPQLNHPNGGESIIAGAHTLIEWGNPQGWTVGHAQIYYSPNDGDTWGLVADQVTGESYAWRAPSEPTENGRLRVVLVDGEGVMGYDSSDGPFAIQAATGVEGVPTVHRLHPNSPNPFRSATRTAFDLPEPGKVTIKVYDLTGREVRVLANGWYPAGTHEETWDARDAAGQPVAAGIYFLHMNSGSFADTKRMYVQR